jgi:hypothetical protein
MLELRELLNCSSRCRRICLASRPQSRIKLTSIVNLNSERAVFRISLEAIEISADTSLLNYNSEHISKPCLTVFCDMNRVNKDQIIDATWSVIHIHDSRHSIPF